MTEPLGEIEFLARSANRIRVLEALASGRYTRQELQAETEASQPTLARILSDFEDRSWIERRGGRYEATPLGELIAGGFTDLLSIVETEVRLRGVARWLPTQHLDVDLRRFRDARITRPTQTDPGGPLKRSLELSAAAAEQHILTYVLNHDMLETLHDAAVEGAQSLRVVASREAVEMIRSDAVSEGRFRRIVASDGVAFRVADGSVPFAMCVADDTVYFLLRDDEGLLRALLESDDDAVRSWAVETVDEYWARGSDLDPSAFES